MEPAMRKDTSFPAGAGAAAVSSLYRPCPSMEVRHPRDVLSAQGIASQEKRAILASWASDMFAVESRPDLRLYPEAEEPVSYDEIIDALKALDEDERLHGFVGCESPVYARRRYDTATLGT
jgi:hypothetical protein